MRVHVDAARCTGHGMCTAVAAGVYRRDAATGRNHMGEFDLPVGDRAVALRGAAACPEGAITVEKPSVVFEELSLGRIGLWTFALEELGVPRLRETAAELEELGYGTLWFGEAFGREALTQATMLLGATSRMVVATGIACVYGRDPVTMAQAQRTLAGAFPNRFLLGLGLSSPMGVQRVRGQRFGPPLATMRDYLDRMSDAPLGPTLPTAPRRVIAALGPKMLRLAAERTWGSLSYLVPVEHTALARDVLGAEPLLAVEQAVVLDPDIERAREVARSHVANYLRVDHYVRSLCTVGFDEADLRDGGTDEVVDALVAYGDVDAIASRVDKQLDAGANHVCLQVLSADSNTVPMPAWRELAAALL
jgi:probable F420-dependent oxidoreductase